MRVFVTGASGWIGSAVVPDLLNAGHEVVGLARSDASAAAVQAAGAEVRRGDLDDLEALRAGAEEADAVVHLAFIHDFSNYGESMAKDLRAVQLFGDALAGTGKALTIASGFAGMPVDRPATEDDLPDTDGHAGDRAATSVVTLDLADRDVRSSVVRLAPTVHGPRDHGFVHALFEVARRTGTAGYVGDGSNHWAAVSRLDAAPLFRLAIESAPPRSVIHAVGEEGIPARAIAEAIGARLGIPAASVEPDQLDWIGPFFAMNMSASSALTQERLGWTPTHPTLIEDIEAGGYDETDG